MTLHPIFQNVVDGFIAPSGAKDAPQAEPVAAPVADTKSAVGWTYSGNDCGIVDGPHGMIACVYGSDPAGEDATTMESNAYLIAAAPSLYEACEMMLDWLRSPPSGSINVADVRVTIESALKLARGE